MPAALDGRDVLGLAPTGTGKTAAFVLPILQHLLGGRRGGVRSLIVAPTRELASQIHAEVERLAAFTNITSAVIFGGVPVSRQVRQLRRAPDIVVACPGRLLDLVSQRALRLDQVEILVLDEADHMFDMGFLPDLRRILKLLPARRQNLLFSATMPKAIRELASAILHKPVTAECGDRRPVETIEHGLMRVTEERKVDALRGVLDGPDFRSAIVFLRTKHRAKRLALRLEKQGHDAIALQGNMSQSQRDRALSGFREGRYDVLVATDIAARGLDIAGVSHVVNFDIPGTPEAYTHRIGRTGRSECTGTAITFVTPADGKQVQAIERVLGEPIPRWSTSAALDQAGPSEERLDDRRGPRGGGRSGPRGGGRPGARPKRGSQSSAASSAPDTKQSRRKASNKRRAEAAGTGASDGVSSSQGRRAEGKPFGAGTESERGAGRRSGARSGSRRGRSRGRGRSSGRPGAFSSSGSA